MAIAPASSTSSHDHHLAQLSELLTARAEIFAGPSTGVVAKNGTTLGQQRQETGLGDLRDEVYSRTLNAAKALFDECTCSQSGLSQTSNPDVSR